MIWNPWKEIKRLELQVKAVTKSEDTTLEMLHRALDRADTMHIALQEIIREEKPTSNATVKRIANIARGALK
jgi:hypothetical protein